MSRSVFRAATSPIYTNKKMKRRISHNRLSDRPTLSKTLGERATGAMLCLL
jgi:hypothetical protein